jgi:hypothetical protein
MINNNKMKTKKQLKQEEFEKFTPHEQEYVKAFEEERKRANS